MTWKPEQITVSAAEVAEFKRLLDEGHGTGFALAAFLAARMPKPKSGGITHPLFCVSDRVNGFNAALDKVARGKQ